LSETSKNLDSLSGIRKSEFPDVFAPMLASPAERPFSGPGWLFEPKLDGIRCIALVKNGKVRLLSRRGLEITYQYPGLALELATLCKRDVVLDGEIIALNEEGRPSFQHLQQRMNLTKRADIARAEANVPAYYFIFDIMHADGYSLTGVKLIDRKPLLDQLIDQSMRVRIISSFADGITSYDACVDNGFEGVVGKRIDSRYESGRRSPSWLKVKAQQTGEFVIGGYTAGQGSRSTIFGALLLGYYDDNKKFVYAGSVGTGFDDRLLREVIKRLQPLVADKCPFVKRPDEKKQVTWANPRLVIEVKFMDWTRDGHLRTPVFLRFRDDREPEGVGRQTVVKPFVASLNNIVRVPQVAESQAKPYKVSTNSPSLSSMPSGPPDVLPAISSHAASSIVHNELVDSVVSQLQSHTTNFMLHVGADKFQITSLDKILWPKSDQREAITKRDYLIYLAQISTPLLHHLHGRALTIIRSPWGVRGRPFYQKHWHTAIPEFFETAVVPDENDENGRREHLLCNNLSTLLFLGQNGILEYHVTPARIEKDADIPDDIEIEAETGNGPLIVDTTGGWLLNYPDYLVFDLDLHDHSGKTEKNKPKESNKRDFGRACEVACVLRTVLEQLNVTPLVKLSGKGGIHVYAPIRRNLDYEHARVLTETMVRFAASARPDEITLEMNIQKRQGKVFLDSSSNIKGKTVISAYSPRITEDATVSLPVSWQEIEKAAWIPCTLQAALERVKKSGDLWKDILTQKHDLRAKISTGHRT
jgi:bifunctional non-homologous end joining protein LigD